MAEDEGSNRSDDELAELIFRLNQVYAQAGYELKVKFEKYMADFARKDKQKQQDLDAGLITLDEYKRWRLGQILIGQRWQEMVDTMTADLVKVDQFAMAMVNDTSYDVFAVNHNYGTFEVEQGSHLNTSYTLYNRDTVAYLVKNQPDLLPAPRVDIPKDMAWNKQHLASAVLQGIMQGESIGKVANRVQNVAEMDRKAALRNARTMVTNAQNAGRQAAYERGEEKGIHGVKMWVAAHDERVRASHAKIDGERVPVDEKFSNGLMHPGDKNGAPAEVYNCRCAMVFRLTDIEPVAKENLKPEPAMSYKAWEKSKAAHQTEIEVKVPDRYKGNFEDFNPLSIGAKERQAFDALKKASDSTGYEYGQIFTGAGSTDSFTSGLPDKVQIDLSQVDGSGLAIYHSHTNVTPLSADDFGFLCNPRVDAIGNVARNGDVFVARIGDGIRPTRDDFDAAVDRIRTEVDHDLLDDPDFWDWSFEERNYAAIREQAFRIAREFKWTLEGGSLNG
jgi:SPP1 gp7 family putative phage head morphogenesis protein